MQGAARALGGDAGPMSGFDGAKVDAAFFAGTAIRRNFLVNRRYGDPAGLFPRSPRVDFDDIAASSDGRWPAPAPVDVEPRAGLVQTRERAPAAARQPNQRDLGRHAETVRRPQYPVPRLV